MNKDQLVRLIVEQVRKALPVDAAHEARPNEAAGIASHIDSAAARLTSLHQVPVGVSNRHVHLSPQAVERLFGHRDKLTVMRELSQPGQYACNETVSLIGPKGRIDRVRILGPARGETQVEISLYDGFTLGVVPPVRDSGDIANTPGVIIQGPRGQLPLEQGLICAARHIHMHPTDAAQFGLAHGQRVQVHVPGPRGITFDHVLVRVSERYRLEMHIDLDEANAGHIQNGTIAYIVTTSSTANA